MVVFGSSLIRWIGLLLLLITLAESTPKPRPRGHQNNNFDYVILGGGTAGLVIASRLTEDPSITVAVIEAGAFEKNNPNVTSSTGLGLPRYTQVDWQYESAPLRYANNQTLIWSAGKGVGGSSLINGMTYMRPASSQIDLWPSLGLDLDWKQLFNYSKRGEIFHPPSSAITALGASYQSSAHGFSGPLTTCISPHMTTGDIHSIFNTTFKNLGIPPRHEFCGGSLRGFGVQAVTQNDTADIREDAARAYYYPVMDRQNLVMMTNTTATRILWSQESTNNSAVASAVEVIGRNGKVFKIYTNREIVLSAGSFRSPAILENSGVGNPSILTKQGIDVKLNLPSIGENFQDQTIFAVSAELKQNFSGFPAFVANAKLQDLFGSNTSSFYNSTLMKLPHYASVIAAQNGGASNADVQQRLLKSQLDLLLESNTPASEIAPIVIDNAVEVVFWPLQPFSRGSVHINSKNKTAQPTIDPRFFQFDFDNRMAVATARFVRRFVTTPPLSKIVDLSTLSPSYDTVPEDASDDVWLKYLKSKSMFQPNYHPLGTCAMLPQASGGVVDNNFKVYGTSNVRIVDMSIVPLQVAGHSTSLLYGIAEYAAQKMRWN